MQDLVSAFGEARGFDEHDLALLKPALKELRHEEVAVHPTAWTRIFPSAHGQEHTRLVQMGAGYATDLDEATTDFLRWRERSMAVRKRVLSSKQLNETARTLSQLHDDLNAI